MGANTIEAVVPMTRGASSGGGSSSQLWLTDTPDPARLFCDADHERLQAMVRVLVSAVTALVLFGIGVLLPGHGHALLAGGVVAGYGLLGLGYLRLLEHLGPERERRWSWRQSAVIAADLAMVGAGSSLLGSAGLGMYPLLLWIIVANGVCFGPWHLGRATLFGVPVFALAHWANGVALAMPMAYLGLLAGLVVLPRLMQQTLLRMIDTNRALLEEKARAEHQALHDTLTDLPNRQLLLQRLEHALQRARRSGARLAVLFLDLDGFKRVNDTLGHDAGDALLLGLVRCLVGRVRDTDTLCRLGGDEFILLVEDYRTPHDLEALIDRLSNCARRFYPVAGHDVWVTWSCGVAVYPRDGGDSSTLLRNADIAMYRAKGQGGDCCVYYDPAMSEQVLRELAMRTELRRAIDVGEFLVYYQPQVDAVSGSVVAVEALVRWGHPGRGLLAPGEFLPVAVASGLMAEVDALVLDLALAALAGLRRDGLPHLRLAVNLSARQLVSPDFVARLRALLTRHGLGAEVLDIETTETALLDEADHLNRLIRVLRAGGSRFVLDDFGTGYSSLAHLRRFELDLVKIDHSFIADLPGDAGDCAMVEGILAIAGRLGLAVAAEGVETAEQRDWLLARGCTRHQGFYYGGPLPLPELRALLMRRAA